MCRFLSILYKTYDQIFLNIILTVFFNKITPYYSFYHTYQVRYRYR